MATETPECPRIVAETLSARCTPRVGIPRRIRFSAPLLDSIISCEIRVIARVISSAFKTVRFDNVHLLLRLSGRLLKDVGKILAGEPA